MDSPIMSYNDVPMDEFLKSQSIVPLLKDWMDVEAANLDWELEAKRQQFETQPDHAPYFEDVLTFAHPGALEDTGCSICYDEMGIRTPEEDSESAHSAVTVVCGHSFGSLCILTWLRDGGNRTCPYCRADIVPHRWNSEKQLALILRQHMREAQEEAWHLDTLQAGIDTQQWFPIPRHQWFNQIFEVNLALRNTWVWLPQNMHHYLRKTSTVIKGICAQVPSSVFPQGWSEASWNSLPEIQAIRSWTTDQRVQVGKQFLEELDMAILTEERYRVGGLEDMPDVEGAEGIERAMINRLNGTIRSLKEQCMIASS